MAFLLVSSGKKILFSHPQVVAFLVAVVTSVAWKVAERTLLARGSFVPRGVPRGKEVKVLACCDVKGNWMDLAWSLLSTSLDPSRVAIHILLECSDPSLVPFAKVDAPELRDHVHVSVDAPFRSRHPCKVVRRLADRFVAGDERLVVILFDPRARTERGWDVLLRSLARKDKGEVVLTAPTSSSEGRPRFAGLRTRSNGTTARGASRPFSVVAEEGDASLVPTPTWCPELTAALPSFWLRGTWPDPKSESFVAQADSLFSLLSVPNAPLLSHDDAMEDDVVDHDEGCPRHTLHRRERVGLSSKATEYERILKFGSTAAARIVTRAAT